MQKFRSFSNKPATSISQSKVNSATTVWISKGAMRTKRMWVYPRLSENYKRVRSRQLTAINFAIFGLISKRIQPWGDVVEFTGRLHRKVIILRVSNTYYIPPVRHPTQVINVYMGSRGILSWPICRLSRWKSISMLACLRVVNIEGLLIQFLN